jgi:hypothetical protein
MDHREKSDSIRRPGGTRGGRGVIRQPLEACRLGDVVSEYLIRQVGPRQAYFYKVVEAWGELIPAHLQEHCTLADLSEGQLKVTVDSPVYLYELRLHRDELLQQLRRRAGRTQSGKMDEEKDDVQPIRQLKFTVGTAREIQQDGR